MDVQYLAGYGVIGDVSRWRVIAKNLVSEAQTPEAVRPNPARSMPAQKIGERCNRVNGEIRHSIQTIISMVGLLIQTDLTPYQRECIQVLESESALLKSKFNRGSGF